MQTDDIDTLSGPELSAAVAREVMGLNRTATDGTPLRVDNGEDVFFEPHADRNDAHAVVVEIERKHLLDDLCWWLRRRIGATQAETLLCDPAIICRAALRAARASR